MKNRDEFYLCGGIYFGNNSLLGGVGKKHAEYKLAAVPIVLRRFRDKLDLRQEEVGERMGVSGNSISRLELGHDYPSIGRLIRLAKALEVRPGELLDAISDQEDALRQKTSPEAGDSL